METVGGLLREWRHSRRLSQLDLALAADISPRYVSLVETGRSRPSAAMVLRLAAELDVPLRHRNRLLVAAGFAPRYRERPLDGPDMSAVRDAVARVLGAHEPYPALVVDRRWNIVMTNAPAGHLLTHVDPALLAPPVNMVRLGLDPRGLASSSSTWTTYVRSSAPGWRARSPGPAIRWSGRCTTSSSRIRSATVRCPDRRRRWRFR